MPQISIVLSAYNAEPYIGKAIESILNQSYENFELLIVDDGSTDNTLEVIRSFQDNRIKAFPQTNTGKSTAVNRMLDIAAGEFVTFQDADDWSAPERLETLVKAMADNRSLGMVFSGYSLVLDDKVVAPRRMWADTDKCAQIIDNYMMPGLDPTMMVRTEIAKTVKFDTSLKLAEGLDFILKVGEKHPIIVIPEVLYYYRFHYQSITKVNPKLKGEYLFKVANDARRRRNQPLVSEEDYFERTKHYISDPNNNLAGHFTDASYFSIEQGYRMEAVATAWTSLKYVKSGGMKYIKPLVYALLPLRLAKMLRKG